MKTEKKHRVGVISSSRPVFFQWAIANKLDPSHVEKIWTSTTEDGKTVEYMCLTPGEGMAAHRFQHIMELPNDTAMKEKLIREFRTPAEAERWLGYLSLRLMPGGSFINFRGEATINGSEEDSIGEREREQAAQEAGRETEKAGGEEEARALQVAVDEGHEEEGQEEGRQEVVA